MQAFPPADQDTLNGHLDGAWLAPEASTEYVEPVEDWRVTLGRLRDMLPTDRAIQTAFDELDRLCSEDERNGLINRYSDGVRTSAQRVVDNYERKDRAMLCTGLGLGDVPLAISFSGDLLETLLDTAKVPDKVKYGTDREFGTEANLLEADIVTVSQSQALPIARTTQGRYGEERENFILAGHDTFRTEATQGLVEPIVDQQIITVLGPLGHRLEKLSTFELRKGLGRITLRGRGVQDDAARTFSRAERREEYIRELDTATQALLRKRGQGDQRALDQIALDLLETSGFMAVKDKNRQVVTSLLAQFRQTIASSDFIDNVSALVTQRQQFRLVEERFGVEKDVANESTVAMEDRPDYEEVISAKVARYAQQGFTESRIRGKLGRYHPDRESGSEEAWKYVEKLLLMRFHPEDVDGIGKGTA